jgi:hypothetical protein
MTMYKDPKNGSYFESKQIVSPNMVDHSILEENATRCPNQVSCDKTVIDFTSCRIKPPVRSISNMQKTEDTDFGETWCVRFKGACENVHRQTDIHSQKGKVLWIGKKCFKFESHVF